jgi:hypothetical protein
VPYLDSPEITAERKDHLEPLNNARSVSSVRGEAAQLILRVTRTLPRHRSSVRTWFPAPIGYLSID